MMLRGCLKKPRAVLGAAMVVFGVTCAGNISIPQQGAAVAQLAALPMDAVKPLLPALVVNAKPVPVSALASFIADHWRLEPEYATRVSEVAVSTADTYGIDPFLLMAIAATESAFRHEVGNPGGGHDPMRPYGIMQVAGRWHADKFPDGKVVRTTLEENLDIGAQVFQQLLSLEKGNERRALARYNGAPPDSMAYPAKVQRVQAKLKQGALQHAKLQALARCDHVKLILAPSGCSTQDA